MSRGSKARPKPFFAAVPVRLPSSAALSARPAWRAGAPRPVAAALLALLAAAAAAQESEPPRQPSEPAQEQNEPLNLRASPKLAEKLPQGGGKPPSFLYGERVSSQMYLQSVAEGNAELRRPGLTARSDRVTHDQSSDIATFQGNVRINYQGNRYTATEGHLQVDAFVGSFLHPTYRFLSTNAYGDADRVDFLDPDRLTLINGNYTSCQRQEGDDWRPDWILEADRLDIDREEDEGHAENVTLRFKGVPILPLPSMSFPLSEQRTSGWLPPTIGLDNRSGLNLAVPYYWNIAPNRDATFTPNVMLRRGINAEGEFRYLEDNYHGRVQASFLPDDRLRNRDRWSLFLQHSGSLETGLQPIGALNLNLNVNRVSDSNYWSDFPHSGLSQINRLLASSASVSWTRGEFTLMASALQWQTLQDVTAPIVPPYDRMPELKGVWARSNDRGFDYSVSADYTRFRGDPALTLQPNANREVLQAQISRPFTRPWGFFTPKAQVHASDYQFERALTNGSSTASRAVPTFSLDSGLVFERNASYFGHAFRQTLEPRLMYVYTPYRNQNDLPNYDSGVYDFNFATIWNENSFVGDDRVVDNNLVTGGLTTRLLDPETGAEAVRLDIAQRYRFSGQQVVLPGGTPTSPGWSDLMLGASLSWDPRWTFDTVLQYNPDTNTSTRTTIATRYSPGPYRTFAVAYRHERDLNSESVDMGCQWPLNDLWEGRKELDARKKSNASRRGGGTCGGGIWYSMGRLNYSLSDRKVVDSVAGVEYDAGCWIGRIAFEQLHSTTTTATRRILFQLEFVGFSRLGSSLMSTLRNNIPRYQSLDQEVPPPSRFTVYD